MNYRIICWFLILFACFYGLGSYPLLDHNEGMYAAIARDMLKSGDFIIPHLNALPYIEKPPLLYWLMAGSMAIFGENEWAVRLIPALALFATAWKMHRFLLRCGKSETVSLAAPLILVTSLPLLAIARMVLCDMLMTCFLSMALIFFYESLNPVGGEAEAQDHQILRSRDAARRILAFYICLALAVMAKGFVAIILAGGSIAVFLLWQRTPWRDWLKALSPTGILLFLAIIAPWHIAASLKEPGFAYFYFINEHVLRFLNMREPHDYYTGHFWYYLVRIPGYLMPWTLLLAAFARRDISYQRAKGNQFLLHFDICPLTSFLWSWFLFCLVFFSASGGKANYYMIAGMPPLVMLMALQLERLIATNYRFVRGLASIAMVLIISAIELAKYFCHEGSGDLYPVCQIITWPLIGLSMLYVAISLALCWRLPARWIMPLLGATVLLLLPLLVSGVAMTGDRVSQKPVAEFLKASGGNVAVYQEFEELSALVFYLDKPLVIVNSQSSDLLYGQKQLPAKNPYFISLAEWTTQTPSLPLVVLNKRMDSFMTEVQALHQQACVEQRFERVSVIIRCNK